MLLNSPHPACTSYSFTFNKLGDIAKFYICRLIIIVFMVMVKFKFVIVQMQSYPGAWKYISLSTVVLNSRDRQGMYGMQHFRTPRNPPYKRI